MNEWESLDRPWQVAFSLAWEAFVEGSVPVGAVLCDENGAILSIGRNRWFSTDTVPRQISGSSIAHAEINALATLPFGYYPRHVLYTTVEPCLLCTAAVGLSHVGTVRFALEDPMWYGMERLKEVNHHIGRFAFKRDGPLDGGWRAWSSLLYLVAAYERRGRSAEVLAGDQSELARRLLESKELIRLRSLTLAEAVAEIGPQLYL
jgi:tRNA(Arg) A34 adenosine deaminase TadA